MRRVLLTLLLASAVYGYSIGSVHSPRLAQWNLIKFPLLLLMTGQVSGLAVYFSSLLVTRRLGFAQVWRVSLRTYADLALLLAALAPVAYFLALTLEQPQGERLNEYPLFLGLNVIFIAVAGSIGLVRQALRLTREHGLAKERAALVVGAWLAISLFVGGQAAWYMRPFFGRSTSVNPPFMEGTAPDFRGATSFYEAVWHLIAPPT